MNTENAENPTVANAVFEYQRLVKDADRRLNKYMKAQAVMDMRREEWKAAQEAANEALIALKEILK